MSYLTQAILFVIVLTGIVMAEAFWSDVHGESCTARSLHRALAAGGLFVFYAVVDYLMIVPGSDYLMG